MNDAYIINYCHKNIKHYTIKNKLRGIAIKIYHHLRERISFIANKKEQTENAIQKNTIEKIN